MPPKIALLSHRGGNIGHDFMAAGMNEAVIEAFGRDVEVVHFEQHRPFDVYAPTHWVRIFNHLKHGRHRAIRNVLVNGSVRKWLWRHLPDMPFGLAVACGGPNIVPGAAKIPEMHLLLHHMNGAFAQRGVSFVDAGVGAAFPLEGVKRLDDAQDIEFYKAAFGYTTHVSVRDAVAKTVCDDLDVVATLIPCGAIGAGRLFERLAPPRSDGRHIVINFQALGANTDWGQGVDRSAWRSTVRAVVDELSKRHAVRFLAHSRAEAALVAEFACDFPCDTPDDLESYAAAIAGAKAGFVSRIHAAIALAGIGVPSLVVGTDTRLGTVKEMKLPTCPVKQATATEIVNVMEDLALSSKPERDRLLNLRETTVKQYVNIFRKNLK
jgi:hypothetical protein